MTLQLSGKNIISAAAAGGGGGGLTPEAKTTSFTSEKSKFYLIDTSAGDVTVTVHDIAAADESVGFQKTTTDSNKIIINADGSDNIDGATQVTITQPKEWKILRTESTSKWVPNTGSLGNGAITGPWTDAGGIIFEADTTNPTKGTIAHDRLSYVRVGNTLIGTVEYRQSSAGSAGSGEYTFKLPSGLTVDTSKLDSDPGGTYFSAQQTLGSGTIASNGNGTSRVSMYYSSDNGGGFKFTTHPEGTASGTKWTSSLFHFGDSSLRISLQFTVPIAEWASSGTTVNIQDLTAKTRWYTGNGTTGAAGTVSTPTANSTIGDVQLQASRDSTGRYFLEGHIAVEHTSSSITNIRVDLDDYNLALVGQGTNKQQAISIFANGNPSQRAELHGEIYMGTGTIGTGQLSARWSSSFVMSGADFGFKVELAEKPAWFDEYAENPVSIDAYIPGYHYEKVTLVDNGTKDINGTVWMSRIGQTVTVTWTNLTHIAGNSVTTTAIIPSNLLNPTAAYTGNYFSVGGNPTLGYRAEVEHSTGKISFGAYDQTAGGNQNTATAANNSTSRPGGSISWVVED